jgi:acetyl-CoA acetyltransferase
MQHVVIAPAKLPRSGAFNGAFATMPVQALGAIATKAALADAMCVEGF